MDVVTKKTGEGDNCQFIGEPSDLTEMNLVFSEKIEDMKSGCALVDNVSVLLVYNDMNDVLKFLHKMITKARMKEFPLILLLSHTEKSSTLSQTLFLFVDKVITRL